MVGVSNSSKFSSRDCESGKSRQPWFISLLVLTLSIVTVQWSYIRLKFQNFLSEIPSS